MKIPNTSLLCARLIALQVLAALAFAGAARAESVAVAGIALNGTTMKPAANLALELINPQAQTTASSLVATARSGADGRFKFPARDVAKDALLIIRAPYQNYGYLAVAYDGAGLFKASGVVPKPGSVQVEVFNSATKPPALTFQVHHLAIESSAKGIKCIERIVVQNPSNSTYVGVGKVKGTVILDIPAGARDIKMDPKIPGKLVKTSHGWAATTPIAPSRYTNRSVLAGPSAIIFEYYMDWPSALPWARKVNLSQRVLYPTNFFFVARTTEDKVLQVTAPRLSKDENQELPIGQETEMRVVNSIGRPVAENPALKADEKLAISITREVNPLFWAFTAFLAAIVLAVPLALRGARKRSAAQNWEHYDDEDGLEYEREEQVSPGAERVAQARVSTAHSGSGTASGGLLSGRGQTEVEAIASLDDEFEAGRLSESEYKQQRAQLKRRLLDSLAAQEPSVRGEG